MDATICNPQNECGHTGLERAWGYKNIGNLTIRTYRDNFDQYRTMLFIDGECVSAVLVGRDKSIRFKYTKPEHRGHGYTRQLQAQLTLFGIDWRMSDHMTAAGRACYG